MPGDYDLVIMNATEPFIGQQLGEVPVRVHPASACAGRGLPCVIHHPSQHHMSSWPLNWRADTGVMERLCPHGVGHPDPDHLAHVLSLDEGNAWQRAHGCDGCCRGAPG